ncbi:MAG TPA: NAD-dependent epimerase/dehydratase family protein, partial [Chloroflexota bacterium]|nr:NAD-dependent epimerase/dehydratase family protein [Chloroflexota bacterium]
MRRALVAGGAGLIGSHLCEYLLGEGYEVVAVDNFVSSSRGNVEALSGRDGFSFMEHDVLDLLPDVGSVDEVYHLASPASPVFFEELAEEIAMVNSVGTWNLLEFARDHRATFLLASTSEIYGDPEQHPQGESYPGNVHTIGLRAPYDESKRFAETLTYLAAQKHRVDARIVRIFNTFGPRMRIDDGRAVVEFIMRALQSEPLVVFGDGTQTRSWCFVTDMVVGIHR